MSSTLTQVADAHRTGIDAVLRAPAPTQHVDVDGSQIAYRVMGRAGDVPLVLAHRFRATLDEWDPAFVELLALHRQIIMFDSAGTAGSTGTAPASVEAIAAGTAAFIRALGLKQVDVLGFSMGGFVAEVLAITEPGLVRRVALVGTGAPAGEGTAPPEDVFFQTAAKPEWDFEDRVILFYGDASAARRRGALAEDRIEQSKRAGSDQHVSMEATGAQVQAIQAYMTPGNGWYERLGELRQPVLVISGDRDRCFPLEHALVLGRRLPDARVEVFSMCGHAPQQQEPARAAHLITEFLA